MNIDTEIWIHREDIEHCGFKLFHVSDGLAYDYVLKIGALNTAAVHLDKEMVNLLIKALQAPIDTDNWKEED